MPIRTAGALGNLAAALGPYGIATDQIPVAFNCFMNLPVDAATGELRVKPPLSKAGDYITFLAEADLIIGLTACSALQSNNGSLKPIQFRIDECVVPGLVCRAPESEPSKALTNPCGNQPPRPRVLRMLSEG